MGKPKIRFKGYTEDWEQRKLGDVCSRVQGNDGRMDLPTLTISAGNGWMRQEDRFSGNIAGIHCFIEVNYPIITEILNSQNMELYFHYKHMKKPLFQGFIIVSKLKMVVRISWNIILLQSYQIRNLVN